MRTQSRAPHTGAVRRPVAAATPVAMPAPLSPLPVAIPAFIRSIFTRWGEPYDPALRLAGPGLIGPVSAFYRRLGTSSGELRLNMRELFQIYRDADLNKRFGLVAELRQEGDAVEAWVDAAARVFFPSDQLLAGHLAVSCTDELEHVLIDAGCASHHGATLPIRHFPIDPSQ